MEDDWEAVADKEVVIRPKATTNVNKWEGEDDDEDVKESWEDEEEKRDEEKSESTKAATPVKTKPNKALKAKLAEQERQAEEEEEERLANMTAEERLAEKLRLQKIQEESDLKSALETFGVPSISDSTSNGLDAFNPESKEEFKEFGVSLSWKVSQYKESPHFPQFIEDLVRSLCVNLSAADIKKVKINVESLHTEKLKLEKQNAKKPAGKGKGKATLRTENDDIDVYQKYGNDYDDYDDFM